MLSYAESRRSDGTGWRKWCRKTTIINILGGIYTRDEGEILIDGKDAGIHGIQDAKAAGINIIHQELVLVPYLSVAENIFLNREPVKGGMVDYGKMYEMAQKFIDDLGLTGIRAEDKVAELTVAQQQMVEIVKSVSFNARIIVMESLHLHFLIERLMHYLRISGSLKKRGIGIIYISHRLSELEQICAPCNGIS